MRPKDVILGLVVAIVWGASYPIAAVALRVVSPFLLVALRFAVVAAPMLVVVPRPQMRMSWFLTYAVGTGVAQFALLYAGIAEGLPAGLASVAIQSVAPFTVILGAVCFRQTVTGLQWAGVVTATAGLLVIAVGRRTGAPLLPLLLVLLAGLCWAVANHAAARAEASNALHMSLWACVVPPIPMALVAIAVSGPAAVGESIRALFSLGGLDALASIVMLGVLASGFCFGAWCVLLQRYPAADVAPLSMLVPVSGLLISVVMLGERLGIAEAAGSAVVLGGVLVASLATRRCRPSAPPSLADARPRPR